MPLSGKLLVNFLVLVSKQSVPINAVDQKETQTSRTFGELELDTGKWVVDLLAVGPQRVIIVIDLDKLFVLLIRLQPFSIISQKQSYTYDT